MHIMKTMRDVSPEEVDAYIYSLEQQGYEVEVIEEKIEMTEIQQETQVGDPMLGPDNISSFAVSSSDYTGSEYML